MRRYIILFLITGIVWAQTEFDTLVLKNKTLYTGVLIKFGNDEIIFKDLQKKVSPYGHPMFTKPTGKLSIKISDIQKLKLSDGTSVIENGIVVATNEKHIKNISYDRYLSIIEAEKHKKSAERAKERKSIYVGCCLIIMLFGFLAYKDLSFGSGFPSGPWPGDGHP